MIEALWRDRTVDITTTGAKSDGRRRWNLGLVDSDTLYLTR